MLNTNTKYIVSPENDKEFLQDVLTELKLSVEKSEADKINFQVEPFTAIVLPKGYDFDLIRKLLPEHEINFRAIGENEIELPFTMSKTYKHHFTKEEKETIANDFCNKQAEKERLELEKADSAKQFKIKIDACDSEIRELAQNHRQGWEQRTEDCVVRIDFKGKVKYYLHKETKAVLATDELSQKDLQLRIDSIQVEAEPQPQKQSKTINKKK